MTAPFVKTNTPDLAAIDHALAHVRAEILRSIDKHGSPFHSAHEGFAILDEERDELWDEVKANDQFRAREEAIQVAAMATRFFIEC